MKKLKYRDRREDGYLFWGYRTVAGKLKETWYSQRSFDRVLANKARRKRQKKKTPEDLARQSRYEQNYKNRNPEARAKYRQTRLGRSAVTGNPAIMAMFYEIRKRVSRCTGFPWHVDHIKPLAKGGEHHENNLQVITAKSNLRKSIS